MDKKEIEQLRGEGIEIRHTLDDVLSEVNLKNLNRLIEIELMLEREQKREITIPLSENDIQELQAGEEYHWTFSTKQGEAINVHLRPEVEEDIDPEYVGDEVTL